MEKLQQDLYQLLGMRLNPRQLCALECYERELIEWNRRFNLTSIRQIDNIRTKHFLDSFSCFLVMRDKTPTSLIDIGTGAGFPGIPLKIILPNLRLVLVESVGKKVEFCRHIVHQLGLEQVEVIQARAEEIGQSIQYREQFDWAVARAVARLPILAEYLLPLVRIGGSMLAQKGESGPAEAHSAENAIHILGGQLRSVRQIELPGLAEDRYLIVIDKIAATPPRYPRRVGVPSKNPL